MKRGKKSKEKVIEANVERDYKGCEESNILMEFGTLCRFAKIAFGNFFIFFMQIIYMFSTI